MSSAGWCCSYEDGNGLWYTPEYPENIFFEHWTLMAERYRDNPKVIGADLRNEIRGINGKTLKKIFQKKKLTFKFIIHSITSSKFLLFDGRILEAQNIPILPN